VSRVLLGELDPKLTVIAGRTLKEVCAARPPGWKVWQAELSMFKGWGEKSEPEESKGISEKEEK
jgi:hypothetical protein